MFANPRIPAFRPIPAALIRLLLACAVLVLPLGARALPPLGSAHAHATLQRAPKGGGRTRVALGPATVSRTDDAFAACPDLADALPFPAPCVAPDARAAASHRALRARGVPRGIVLPLRI